MSIKKTDVLGNLVYASVSMSCASEIPGYNGSLFAISDDIKERIESELTEARAAVAELIEALRVAVRQNSHDMLMTGEELRQCEHALAATGVQP